jgi:hypothetical protein
VLLSLQCYNHSEAKRGHPCPLSPPYCSPCGVFNSFTNVERRQKGFRSSARIFFGERTHATCSDVIPEPFQREIIKRWEMSREYRTREPHIFVVVFYVSPRPPPPSPDTIAMAPLMDQITKKTPNPKCRLFFKIDLQRDLAAGVYLSEAT